MSLFKSHRDTTGEFRACALQETLATLLQDSYLSALREAEDKIKEYQFSRRNWRAGGLSSSTRMASSIALTRISLRRLRYDTALIKLEKLNNSNKDKSKERKEANDECELAQLR